MMTTPHLYRPVATMETNSLGVLSSKRKGSYDYCQFLIDSVYSQV